MENIRVNLVFLLFSAIGFHLFTKKQNCRNLSLIKFRLFTTASYKSEVLQAKENSTEFPQTDG